MKRSNTLEHYGSLIRFFDGHNDVLLSLHLTGLGPQPFVDGRPFGHLDLERARAGGFAAGCFAIFVPADDQRHPGLPPVPVRDPPYAQPLAPAIDGAQAALEAGEMIDLLYELERVSAGELVVATGIAAIEAAIGGGPLAAVLHFEGAEPVDPSLDNLEAFYGRGLRSLGLVWSRPNAFAEGVPFAFPQSPDTGAGLTDAGRELVRECNRLGIMLDLSHLNERGFRDVAELSEKPLVASHSNAHALSAITRNLTDAQLDAVGSSNGIVGITVHAGMLREDGRIAADTPLARVLDHVDYVVDRIGIDHVGFGSDFDGAIVVDELQDAAGLPRLVDGLRGRGYGEAEIAKLAHENWLRVLRATWTN